MTKDDERKDEDVIPYEEARIEKDEKDASVVEDKDVEAANIVINPDKSSMESRG